MLCHALSEYSTSRSVRPSDAKNCRFAEFHDAKGRAFDNYAAKKNQEQISKTLRCVFSHRYDKTIQGKRTFVNDGSKSKSKYIPTAVI